MKKTILVAFLSVAAQTVAAGEALVIGNARYSTFDTVFGAERVGAAAQALRDRGLSVTEAANADASAMRGALARFVAGIEESEEPLVIVLSGAFVHGPSGAWLLPAGAAAGDAAAALTQGLPLDAVLSVLAARPGRAFLVLGESPAGAGAAPFLSAGPGHLEVPQGVTVIRGPAPEVARFATRVMPRPEVALAPAAAELSLDVDGYAPEGLVVLRAQDATTQPVPATRPDEPAAARASRDDSAWRRAEQMDSAEGYRIYLEAFPEGQNAAAARQRLRAIDEDPFYAERRAEEAMELTREERREVQQNLSILGYDTRGIDGIFGPGTRSAIEAWQRAEGYPATGLLTAQQVTRLRNSAETRAAEIEREAQARAAAREAADQRLWDRVSGQGREEDLRRYLQDFPDGMYSDRARALLSDIEEQRADQAAAQDRQAWQSARDEDNVAAYRRYLEQRPDGAFRGEAQARIAALQSAGDDAAARAEEEALGLGAVGRRLAEVRLSQLGLDPGQIDGAFDGQTRRAIRSYQRDRDLTVTGYLDQATVVRLLAGGLEGLFSR
ncbi:peptidoglycan-binding protein [Citreimonas salinaria]|uniref:Putative peptidoglycan binding domain-containing protein n=1 Tax=Citreimonas salinaria TaxID=321339 RepID=A0A1H3M998_9RHOB|nr:peptidoglycan-binding protein [Citreimonas salinaria]SDY73290.1 Putative peptidoglycan binding domain-containing protein [Citreimonas salinaria]